MDLSPCLCPCTGGLWGRLHRELRANANAVPSQPSVRCESHLARNRVVLILYCPAGTPTTPTSLKPSISLTRGMASQWKGRNCREPLLGLSCPALGTRCVRGQNSFLLGGVPCSRAELLGHVYLQMTLLMSGASPLLQH